MKAIFVSYNQAYYLEIMELLEEFSCKGFTLWEDVKGRGSADGEPHLGSHAWPTLNHAMLAVVEDNCVDGILDAIRQKDEATPELGLRAFVWTVDKAY